MQTWIKKLIYSINLYLGEFLRVTKIIENEDLKRKYLEKFLKFSKVSD